VTENVLGTIITLKEAESTIAVPVFNLACSHFFAQFANLRKMGEAEVASADGRHCLPFRRGARGTVGDRANSARGTRR
jgi:hypothetical protein